MLARKGFKAILRKHLKHILNFTFNKEAIVISNKNDDYLLLILRIHQVHH